MYECPNCGGTLRFEIRSQQLACAYCSGKFNPYEIAREKDAEEQNEYEVTVFCCPQCGGERFIARIIQRRGFAAFVGRLQS